MNMIEKAKEVEVQRRLASFTQSLDKDGNGLVHCADVLSAFDIDHVNSLFVYLGVTPDDIKSLFKACDCEGNSTIEFVFLQRFCENLMAGEAQAINLYKLYASAARVSKRALEMGER